jgi:HlyD family secretion protein
MDRPIDVEFRRARLVRRAALAVGVLTLAVAAFVWLPGLVSPSINRARIRTALVDTGPIEASITATGLVVPEVEEVVSSPVDARVTRILKRAGADLMPGDPIVELDTSESALAVDKLARSVAIKANDQARARIDLERSLNDLDSQATIKDLQLQTFRSQLTRNRQLAKEGLISDEQLKQAELAEAQADIELKRLQTERINAQRSAKTQLEGLALEMATLEKELGEARRQLNLAAPKAGRKGVLTWALTAEGGAIRKGDVVARIADLSSYRVEASVSDVHARRLVAGLPVAVKVGDDTLEGVLSSIQPTIQNGVITFQVTLKERSSSLLRSNLRVDVLVVTGRKARAIRVRRGPFADGEGRRDVFVVRGSRAYRTPVDLGLAGFDEVEVVQGLRAGDEVIISDMRDYAHLSEIGIR